jgi:hypothetical protein
MRQTAFLQSGYKLIPGKEATFLLLDTDTLHE